jgi:non-ribosomal peptide synthetase component E (peptide arylation enzyme)
MVSRLRATGLATYKLPERLDVLEELPTTASGKVQKHEIVRRLVEADRSQGASAGVAAGSSES